jgi:hypothetical protein
MEEILRKEDHNDPQHVMELNFEVQALRNKLAQATQIIEKLSDERAIARVNFLFKILKYKDMFSEETVKKTVDELELIMFATEEDLAKFSNE